MRITKEPQGLWKLAQVRQAMENSGFLSSPPASPAHTPTLSPHTRARSIPGSHGNRLHEAETTLLWVKTRQGGTSWQWQTSYASRGFCSRSCGDFSLVENSYLTRYAHWRCFIFPSQRDTCNFRSLMRRNNYVCSLFVLCPIMLPSCLQLPQKQPVLARNWKMIYFLGTLSFQHSGLQQKRETHHIASVSGWPNRWLGNEQEKGQKYPLYATGNT